MSYLAVALLFLSVPLPGSDAPQQPPELGRVRFGRDLDAALATAQRDAKPVFLLFQEIPGCQTCRDFGAGPLSHPRLVEAIETLFVPVAIHNNKDGADAAALKRFGEPAWNNPVVRFVDGAGKDVIPRRDEAWSAGEVAQRTVAALAAAKQAVPRWLALACLDLAPAEPQRAVFTMHCYWEGQQRLGSLDGVIDARPGFLGEDEVVDVRFDAARVSLADLAQRASEMECASAIHVVDRKDLERLPADLRGRCSVLMGDVRAAGPNADLRRLRGERAYNLLPLSRAQALRANGELAANGALRAGTLSPRQEELRRRIAAADPALFAGLTRPTDPAGLAGHEDELLRRLAP